MFGPDYQAACPSCSSIADSFNGVAVHLANHDVMLWAVSRAPIEKLLAYKRRTGWTFPWASSIGSDFNFDFNASYSEEQQGEGIVYNFTRQPQFDWRAGPGGGGEGAEARFAAMCGVEAPAYRRQRPGMSTFALEDGVVFHAYSCYARGLDVLWGMHQSLDRAPKGRNETGRLVAPPRRVRDAARIRRVLRATGRRLMTRQCCVGGPLLGRFARRLSILPPAALVFLPKCPLCLAVCLTAATGIRFSAAGAAWVRGGVVLLCVRAAAPMIIRRSRPRPSVPDESRAASLQRTRGSWGSLW